MEFWWTNLVQFQLLSHVRLFATQWTAAHQASLSITDSQSLLKLMSIKSVMPSKHLLLCHPLLLLPSIFPNIRVFPNESVLCIRWPKYWGFSFSINPSNEYSGVISSKTDWCDLHAVQGTLKSLLQHHSSKTSILWHSAFFMVQLSHPFMTTRKTIALTSWTFVSKLMSLLFNMLSRLVIAFLPRSELSIVFTIKPYARCWGIWKKCVFMFSKWRHWHNYHGNSGKLKLQMWVDASIQYFWTTWILREASCDKQNLKIQAKTLNWGQYSRKET